MKVENVLQSVKSLNATKIKKTQASCGWITFLLEAQSIVSGTMVVLVHSQKIIPIGYFVNFGGLLRKNEL